MGLRDVPVLRFHPRDCAAEDSRQLRVVEVHSSTTVAVVVCHVDGGMCFVTAHVYAPEFWKGRFTKVRIAEAVHDTKLTYITKVTYESQWV